jgi:hypothetical protein
MCVRLRQNEHTLQHNIADNVAALQSSKATISQKSSNIVEGIWRALKFLRTKSFLAHTGKCNEEVGGRNSCFTLFQWKRNSGQPSPALGVVF